jgi:hypothetical protein
MRTRRQKVLAAPKQVVPPLVGALRAAEPPLLEDVPETVEVAARRMAAPLRLAQHREAPQLVVPQLVVHRQEVRAKRSRQVERQLQALAGKQRAEATRLVSRTHQLQAVRAKHRVVRLAILPPAERAQSLAVLALALRARVQPLVLRVA